ncbi:hypothetical protein [Burkholderia aenigmatica]|uniref:hypothetical protein n=1 Tax=Burkholderia aenigmatica TaxID=2015348 RepID=UPI00264ADDD5|nr:hypothetical protein [Burkholderia aenigmatica]MDN7874935.1 hypothetical protein [Burkholderia aenigmatica]
MQPSGWVTLTMHELGRFYVIQGVPAGKVKPWRAANPDFGLPSESNRDTCSV